MSKKRPIIATLAKRASALAKKEGIKYQTALKKVCKEHKAKKSK